MSNEKEKETMVVENNLQEDNNQEITKRVGKVRAIFKGRVIKRDAKGIYFELDPRIFKYDPETTYPPRFLVTLASHLDDENPDYPFKETLKPGFDYTIVCELDIDGDKKTKRNVFRYWLNKFVLVDNSLV